MLFFLIVLSMTIVIGCFFLGVADTNGLFEGAFAAWMAFCFLAGLWVIGGIAFVLYHFASKYW